MRPEDFRPDDLFAQIQGLVDGLAAERAARQAAEAADKAKSDLVAMIGHELRAPLEAVVAMAELLRASSLDPTQARYADTLYQSARGLLGALSDVPWATRDVGYYNDSAPNAVWIDEFNDYADVSLVSPTYDVPAGSTATVTFHHSYTLWAPEDSELANGVFNGGVFEISVGGAPFQDVAAAGGQFTMHGYDATLDPSFDNPLAAPPALARRVWGGDSQGFVTTKVTLPAAASVVATSRAQIRVGVIAFIGDP